jgi:hypothetical protein
MKRLLILLCGFALSTGAWLGSPQAAEARPICPRGQTFTNCLTACPNDIVAACAQSIGNPNTTCPVDEANSSCDSDAACYFLTQPPGLWPVKITCPWYP